jgi:hypothetical protein
MNKKVANFVGISVGISVSVCALVNAFVTIYWFIVDVNL